tara:strand:- start:663 stop:1661 length:999 start_codon:yes stop_codon:yes gene_type:complete
MELDDLAKRLLPFSQAHYNDKDISVSNVTKMPGHAGFSYGFTVTTRNREDSWYIRLPPPNVKLEGTADVMRQVTALNLLPDSVPHCKVKWFGEDPSWFGRPYFIVPFLEGDTVRLSDSWIRSLPSEVRLGMAKQAVMAMSEIHNLDWSRASYLGAPIRLDHDVNRWDRFCIKGAEQERLKLVPKVRELLIAKVPKKIQIGIFHGDFQWSNLFFSKEGELLAVIDWELVGIGSVLNDIGWFATFNDPMAWDDANHSEYTMPNAEELISIYSEMSGTDASDINWYRALSAYKFAIITSFNLMLHRRGKRQDPAWEITKDSIEPLLERARSLLTV